MTSFIPIAASASGWVADEPGITRLRETDRDEITEVLMGRRVTKVDEEHVLLDDGTTLKMLGHDGGCACSAGCYDLTVLNGCDNVITRVEFEDKPADDSTPYDSDEYGFYRIWVYADNERINLMQVDGDDGNGYYGTGYEIAVRPPAVSA